MNARFKVVGWRMTPALQRALDARLLDDARAVMADVSALAILNLILGGDVFV